MRRLVWRPTARASKLNAVNCSLIGRLSHATARFLDNINTEFEQSFSLCAAIFREMGCVEESLLAAKRVFSYNPNSTRMLELFPQFSPYIEQISRLVEFHGQKLQADSSNPELCTILGYCYLTLRVQPESMDPVFWSAMGVVYSHSNSSDHALNCHQKVLALDSKFIYGRDVLFRLGLLYRQLTNSENALHYLEQVRRDPPNGLVAEDISLQIGYTRQLMSDHNAALTTYRELYRQFPGSLQLTIPYAWLSSCARSRRKL